MGGQRLVAQVDDLPRQSLGPDQDVEGAEITPGATLLEGP